MLFYIFKRIMSQFQIVPPHIIEITKKKKLNLIYFSWHFQLFQKEHIKYIKISSVVQPKVRLFSKSFSSGSWDLLSHKGLGLFTIIQRLQKSIKSWGGKEKIVWSQPTPLPWPKRVTLDFGSFQKLSKILILPTDHAPAPILSSLFLSYFFPSM